VSALAGLHFEPSNPVLVVSDDFREFFVNVSDLSMHVCNLPQSFGRARLYLSCPPCERLGDFLSDAPQDTDDRDC